MKFKKGDKVRILDGSKIEDYAGGWYVCGMEKYVGRVATVQRGETFACKTRYCLTDCGGYVWDERGLELVTDEQIIIYRKDDEVIALDKSSGVKGVAKCSPEDKFDFKIGAKLAFERLIGEVKEVKREAKVGEYIKIVDAYATKGKYKNGDILRVSKVFDSTGDTKHHIHFEGGGYTNIVGSEYVVLENYNPIKIVKQDKYEIGDKVKIIDKWVDGCGENSKGEMDKWLGKIMTVRTADSHYRMEEDLDEHCGNGWSWNTKCIEGKVVNTEPTKPKKDEPKFKVGDIVKVINTGETYSSYSSWSGLKNFKSHYVRHKSPIKGKKYKVINLKKHDRGIFSLALIQDEDTTQVFIIGTVGIEKVSE